MTRIEARSVDLTSCTKLVSLASELAGRAIYFLAQLPPLWYIEGTDAQTDPLLFPRVLFPRGFRSICRDLDRHLFEGRRPDFREELPTMSSPWGSGSDVFAELRTGAAVGEGDPECCAA